MGGKLAGQVRAGKVPAGLAPAFELQSPVLSEVIRDINKYSNNVMAQQLFLTLSLQQKGQGTAEGSRELLRQWWQARFGAADAPVIDNGSGLSRESRLSAVASPAQAVTRRVEPGLELDRLVTPDPGQPHQGSVVPGDRATLARFVKHRRKPGGR